MADPAMSLAAMGFDVVALLGTVGFLFVSSGPGEPVQVETAELRFIPCHCDRYGCSGVRRVRAFWQPLQAF
jgi:hypothetical protein